MADQSMLSLFENDASFLDELTAGGGGAMAQATQAIGQAESGMMAPGMDSGISGVGMQNPMAQQMTPQQQTPPQYQQIAGIPQAAAKLQHYSNQYDQFAAQKYPGMADASSGSISQGNTMMSSSPQQQHQFGSPPPGGARMQSPGPNYQGYRMHGSNQVTPPQQQQPQMGMSPQAMWPQAAGMPAGANMAARTQFMQQNPRSQLSQYIQQHEYNQPTPQQYPNQQASQMYAQSPIGSPPPTQRLSHMPMSSSSGLGHPTGASRYPVMTQASVMPMQGAHSMHSYNASTNTAAVRPGLHQGAPMQQATLNSGIQMNNSRLTQYQGYSAQMQQQQSLRPSSVMAAAAQNISNGPVSPYQPQNSTQSTYHQGYPGIGPQGPNASPRPTPPPQSQATSQYLTGSTGPQATQGFSAQSNIRQQYMPTVSALNSTGIPPTAMGSSRVQYGMDYPPNVVSTSARQISPSSTGAGKFGFGGTMTQAGGMNTGGLLVNTTSAISSNTISQPSPSLASPHDIELEIQQLQGQVQQLYNMPQTPETQQKMLDLQERARSLRAQQQKHLLIQQRTQQQVAPTQQPPVRSMLSPKAAGPRPLAPTPPQTVRQPTPNPITPSPPQPILPQPQLGSEATSAPQSQPVLAMPPVSSISPGSVTSQPQLAATQVSPASSEGPSSLAQPDLQLQILTSSPEQPDFTAEPITPPLSDSLLLPDSLPQMPNTDHGINTPTAQSPEPEDPDRLFRAQQNQEKAQKIVDEAIAKAKAEGRDIPQVAAVTEEEVKEKPKEVKKRKRPKKKVDKEKSDGQKEDGTSPEKPPKEKKKREPRKRKPKKDTPSKKEGETDAPKDEGEPVAEEGGAPKEKKAKPEKEKKPKTPSRPKSAKKKKIATCHHIEEV